MEATKAQLERLNRDLKVMAKGEEIAVEEIGGTFYAFGSELATLRIFAKYNSGGCVYNDRIRCGYSENLKKFFVSIEPAF